MKPKSKPQRSKDTFWRFLVARAQLPDWIAIGLTCLLGYIALRICYPTPATYFDSFSYVATAASGQFSIYRPFGYSWLLRAVHTFSSSMTAVVVVQFLLYALTAGMLLMALKRYYPLRTAWLRLTLEVVAIASPAAFYMLNALMSDALFCCCILMMIAMALVMIHEKSAIALLLYLLAFYASLYARYSAMFFPIAFIPIFLFIPKTWLRWTSAVATLAVFLLFHSDISGNMEQTIHRRQFSTGFDGWQLANNAMHVLPHIDTETSTPTDPKLSALHRFCAHRYDAAILEATDSGSRVCARFLWSPDFPLKQYHALYINTMHSSYPVAWVKLGSGLYADYGKWLIFHYPIPFLRYYLLPNACSAFFPYNLEMVGNYTDIPATQKETLEWFQLTPERLQPARHDPYGHWLGQLLPVIELITWALLLAAIALIAVRRRTALASRDQRLAFWMLLLFGFVYYATTVFASPIAIRYWMPMQAIKMAMVWMAIASVKKSAA
ncbi:MAG: hypothetical protein IJU19_07765 [Bacteroidales bacterium]|nr:hypothetical protein [Bacteroidales bacterium]